MPHFILEYTDNLREEVEIQLLLQKINQSLLTHRDLIPIGGLRSRAIELKNYVVADGTEDDAFVHATLKLGKGRSDEEKQILGHDVFQTMKEHFKDLAQKRFLALSLEIYEFTFPTYKFNNIHSRYKENFKQ